MAYVPGFQYDIFVSYAHGDNRLWIERFIDRLKSEIKPRLGVEPAIWIDDDNLRRERDFRLEIPETVEHSAVFLLLPSPSYIRSSYCVREECAAFRRTLAARRERFNAKEFANSLFAFCCPILAVENNEHRELFPGATDIPFCDGNDTFKTVGRRFEQSLSKLVGEVIELLRRMRHHATPIFLYPPAPTGELTESYNTLAKELSADGYRVLPETQTNLENQLRGATLSVFLLGERYDEMARRLTDLASTLQKRWMVWRSPGAKQSTDLKQRAFCRELEQNDAQQKIFLNETITPVKLKEEVYALLRPATKPKPSTGRPSVFLIYNLKDGTELDNAGAILLHYDSEFHFTTPEDVTQRTARLRDSDGVLLIWGSADRDWWEGEVKAVVQTARAPNRGLCLFDPQTGKTEIIPLLRESLKDFSITEEFGKFDPARLEGFFDPIRQRWQEARL